MVVHNLKVRPNPKNLAKRSVSLREDFVNIVQPEDRVEIEIASDFGNTTLSLTGNDIKNNAVKKQTKVGNKTYYVYRF